MAKKFIVTIDTMGTAFYEPDGEDICLALSNAFHGSLVTADDVCPACFGDCERLHNDGLMHKCTVCDGTGKRK